jgi:hypothetical protein
MAKIIATNYDEYYAPIRRGLFTYEHFEKMGLGLWVFGYFLTRVPIGSTDGVIHTVFNDEEIAQVIGMSARNVRLYRQKLIKDGYLVIAQTRQGYRITVNKWHKDAVADAIGDNIAVQTQAQNPAPLSNNKKIKREIYITADAEDKPKKENEHWELAKKIATVCKLPFEVGKERGKCLKVAKDVKLIPGFSEELLLATYSPGGAWYDRSANWRVAKNPDQAPTPFQITETWNQLNSKVPPPVAEVSPDRIEALRKRDRAWRELPEEERERLWGATPEEMDAYWKEKGL